jgi:TRAP-type C4-dicarboxylate transport system permease small subunit
VRAALTRLSEGLALLGGALLLGVIGVTVFSVVRGAAFGRPLLGDTEVAEMLVGVAVALFLPWCEMRGAPVIVDFFTAPLRERAKSGLDALVRGISAVVVCVLALRLTVGGYDNWDRERDTMFLQIPYWWGYAGAALGMAAWAATAWWVAYDRFRTWRMA